VVSRRSVQRYRQCAPARPPSQSWRTFLANHRPQLWAADLLTVQTLAFRTLYVLLVEFERYHNAERPHRTLELETPIQQARFAMGPICSRPVLDGLSHVYKRAA
jgi:hypothetical protein